MNRPMDIFDRNDLILRIRIACELSLFDDARENMRWLIVTYGAELTVEERNLFAVFYKSLICKFRKEYNLYIDLQREIPRKEILKHRILRDNMYRARYEVVTICEDVIEMINENILVTKNIESKIYFIKLRGDYFRYWASVAKEDQVADLRSKAEDSYKEAFKLADRKLKKHHPLRLGLMLNMSVHYYAVPRERLKAIQLSMQAVTEGKEHIAEDPDIRAAVNLLRDNLDAWMSCLDAEEKEELERLEGARKWHGKEAAIPSAHLVRRLAEEPSPEFDFPLALHQRHSTILQPNLMPSSARFQNSESLNIWKHYLLLRPHFPHLYEPLFEAREPLFVPVESQISLDEGSENVTESQSDTTEVRSIVVESQGIVPHTTITSDTVLAEGEIKIVADYDDSLSDKDTFLLKTVSLDQAEYEKHVSAPDLPEDTRERVAVFNLSEDIHEEHASVPDLLEDMHEEQLLVPDLSDSTHEKLPDLFEGIIQPILSPSLSTVSSRPPSEDDNVIVEEEEYHSSLLQASSPYDIPTNQHKAIPTTIDPISRLTRKLHSFESRMLAIQRRLFRTEEPIQLIEVEPGSESEDEWLTSSAMIEKPQTFSGSAFSPAISSYFSQQLTKNETQVTSQFDDVTDRQPQPQSMTTDPIQSDCATKFQEQHSAILSDRHSSRFSTFLDQVDYFVQHQKDQRALETESVSPSAAYEHLVFPEIPPPTPPPKVILTQFGPKIIGNYLLDSSLEGAVAAISSSPSTSNKLKTVTFSERCTLWPYESTGEALHKRSSRQRERSNRRSSTQKGSTFPFSSDEEEEIPCMPGSRSSQQVATISQQETREQQASLARQACRKGRAMQNRREKLMLYKTLRRSFSAQREGAAWPMSSLVREPPYFIYKVLRRASSTGGLIFGRRFLSAHSSFEDLYDEAAEKAFPDPWAPRGERTMLNTFPITPLCPNQKPHVPLIQFHWPYRRETSEQNLMHLTEQRSYFSGKLSGPKVPTTTSL
uniref:14-3-3 domain-containing protein n=1 Tax=Setaria digitata TaxID=48799 RepID=A0A915Q7F6_9BILA